MDEEIKRTKEAIAKTKSPYLKRDLEKHLKRLYKMRGDKHGKRAEFNA